MKKRFLTLAAVLFWPVVALANGDNGGHMDGRGPMMNFWYGGISMWILILVVILVVVYLVLQSIKPKRFDSSFRETPRARPIDILERRYAKGEITREEFEKMRRDLTGN